MPSAGMKTESKLVENWRRPQCLTKKPCQRRVTGDSSLERHLANDEHSEGGIRGKSIAGRRQAITKVRFRAQGDNALQNGARMEPTRAAIERNPKARFRISVGNTSTVCTYTTAKATALKELPRKKITMTRVASSIRNRIDKKTAQPRKANTNAFRE